MYSPKISEELVRKLYRIKVQLKRPMTKVVDEMIEREIETYYKEIERSNEELCVNRA